MTAANTTRGPVGVTGGAPAKGTYRPEVQGLRALAVLMVASYHIWLGKVSGGVDVFLLISAFLLSLSFIRKVEGGRALNLRGYWAHVFQRLLPAVSVVLVGTLVASALFVPRSRWNDILSQAWSSLFYVQNWSLASSSVDYYASDKSLASPLQHFWSLSVQGQVFILWPLLFALAALIARSAKLRYRTVVLAVFGTVFVVSLIFSVYETYTNQAYAYFDTRARLWEFAFGTLLALALPYARLPRGFRIVAGWAGLATMLSAGFVFDVQGQFPGYVALVPLLAAALVILAGQTGSAFGADRILSWKPLIRLGDMSYALYLWHWPVLVIYLIWRGRTEVGLVGGTAILGLSLVLAYLTTRFVERPMRRADTQPVRKFQGAVVIACCLAVAAVPVSAAQIALRVQADNLLAGADRNNPGAAVLVPGFQFEGDPDAPVLPLAETAAEEWPEVPDGCTDNSSLELVCDMWPAREDAPSVVVLGSSHAQSWISAVAPLAQERGWNMSVRIKGWCPLTFADDQTSECREFNRTTMGRLLEDPPNLVVTTGSRTVLDGEETVEPTWISSVEKLLDAGITVAAVRDTPRLDVHAPSCTSENPESTDDCGVEASRLFAETNPAEGALIRDGLIHIDLTDYFCPNGFCSPVIGNVLVYIDNNHVTKSYIRSLTPLFTERLDQGLQGGAVAGAAPAEVVVPK